MDYIRLGKTDLLASRTAFGAMSLEKSGAAEDVATLVKRAYDAGINFFDISRNSSASEKFLGDALHAVRQNIIIATKSSSLTAEKIEEDIEESLSEMHVDAIDLYQFETDTFVPMLNGADGIYRVLENAKENEKIKHIGIVTKDVSAARTAIKSGLYETVQVPFNALVSMETVELTKFCADSDVGFIAMQPLCGGVIRDVRLAFGYIRQHENVIPVWGFRTLEELEQILELEDVPPTVDEKFRKDLEQLRRFFS